MEAIAKPASAEPISSREGSPAAGRLVWIDLAKAIGIALVVIGHACAEMRSINANWTRDVIYLFHMPLFFMVSGYLAKPGPILSYVRERLNALIVPYLCYLVVIGIPVALATHQLDGRSLWLQFARYLYGGPRLVTYMSVFWFITCLFFAQIAFRGILHLSTSTFDLRVVGIVAICTIYSYVFMPRHHVITLLDIGVVPMAMVFLWLGRVYRTAEHRSVAVIGACVAAMIGLGVYLRYFPLYEFDMKAGKFGPFLPGLSSAVALTFLLFEICKRLAASQLAVACMAPFGQASLTIMFLSEPIRRLLWQTGVSAPFAIAAALTLPVIVHKSLTKNPLLSRLLLGQTVSALKVPARS